MNQIFDFFLEPYRTASTFNIIIEIIAVIFGIASVWYAQRENILVFPTGIINTVIFVYLCYVFTLYGDLTINIYYTLMSVYGWYMWKKTIKGEEISVTKSTSKDWKTAILIFTTTIIFVVCVYLYFDRFDRITDYIDTITTGIFFAAMWLMANKKIEHWILWIVADIISIPLYFVKGLGFTGLQFIIFLILAIQGYRAWKTHLNNNHQTA
ncbi:nicotinamide riboside transporter PnuC [Winogradskyella pacifica]|jgi:nicotinamide mononucleotide transporter|uniref:Nicotinamide riboside transporter PnuC n=1 Tax=Winogradskyella pacifica TaxID=664642 RepID=A0A3D9N8H3_9FLAO|nr:nicotinamide riboside transporter PnuC [Winogradskyella pacifica]REE27756.1 nicotinamide mononucleotide transporter [Winogradskyella pacifica]